MNKSKTTSFAAGLVLGTAIGSSLALVLAPTRGEETRQQLKNRGLHLRQRGGEAIQGTVYRSREAMAQGKAKLTSMVDRFRVTPRNEETSGEISFEYSNGDRPISSPES